MAQNTLLEGLRSQILTQIFGRRLGLTPGNSSDSAAEYLAGFKAVRMGISGVTSGSTIVSTSVSTPLPAFGISLIGASGASGTTAYLLAAPVPGVRKYLFNPTTGLAVVGTTDAGAFVASSGSITSTYGILTFAGKGANIELMGLTTALWGAMGQNFSTYSTMVSIV